MLSRVSIAVLLVGSLTAATSTHTATVIRASDFRYIGAFSIPPISGTDTSYSRGLTHRYVDGKLRFFTASWTTSGKNPNHLIEFAPPANPSAAAPYPPAKIVKNWGSAWHQGKRSGVVYGLYWDEIDQRLYWITTSEYSGSKHRRTLAYGEIDPETQTFVAHGNYGFQPQADGGPGYKWLKGLTAIPQPYRERLNGWRLAGGFGGNESVMATGGTSVGPALIAFDHTKLKDNADLPPSAFEKLVYHGIEHRGRRNPHYRQSMDKWHARDGVGYWTWADQAGQAGVWIHTRNKQCFLLWVRQAMGGETANYTKVERIEGTNWGRRLTLADPLENVRVGDLICVPDISRGHHPYVAARVKAVDGASLEVTLMPTKTLNPSPEMPPEGEVWRGLFYYNATLMSTTGRTALFVYDSEDLLAGIAADKVPYHSEEAWPVPTMPAALPSWTNSDPGKVQGVTFDTTTNRLYLLLQAAYPFPPKAGSRAMVFVYELNDEPLPVPNPPTNVRFTQR